MTDVYNFQGESHGGNLVYVVNDDGGVSEYPAAITGKWLLACELYAKSGGEMS